MLLLYYITLFILESFIFFSLSHDHVTYDYNMCNIISYLSSKSKIKKKRNIKIK